MGNSAQHRHARAQQLPEPALQTIERINQGPDFRGAAPASGSATGIKR